jgi:hypothetical protein
VDKIQLKAGIREDPASGTVAAVGILIDDRDLVDMPGR